jgi:hypothetical protein
MADKESKLINNVTIINPFAILNAKFYSMPARHVIRIALQPIHIMITNNYSSNIGHVINLNWFNFWRLFQFDPKKLSYSNTHVE